MCVSYCEIPIHSQRRLSSACLDPHEFQFLLMWAIVGGIKYRLLKSKSRDVQCLRCLIPESFQGMRFLRNISNSRVQAHAAAPGVPSKRVRPQTWARRLGFNPNESKNMRSRGKHKHEKSANCQSWCQQRRSKDTSYG